MDETINLNRSTPDYETQAQAFLANHGLILAASYVGPECPPWGTCPGSRRHSRDDMPCGGVHGGKYIVTIAQVEVGRDGKMHHVRHLEFPFWNSYLKEYGATSAQGDRRRDLTPAQRHKWATHPTAYDVLARISSDWQCPTTFKEWCAEYGYDEDSRKAEATYRRCRDFAYKLRCFFSETELRDLSRIQ